MVSIFKELAFRCFYVALLISATQFWVYVNFGMMLEYGLSCFVYHHHGFFCFEALSWQWLSCASYAPLITGLTVPVPVCVFQSAIMGQCPVETLTYGNGATQLSQQLSFFGKPGGFLACAMQDETSNTMQALSTSSKSWAHLNLACALIFHGADPKTHNVGLALHMAIHGHVPWLGFSVLNATSFLASAVFKPLLHKGLWLCHGTVVLSFLAWFIGLAVLNLFYEFTLEPLDSELFTT